MADYIPITEAQSDPEAPVDSSLIKRLRDNPIAMAEGATGSPGLFLRALERLEPGEEIRSRRDEEVSTGIAQSTLIDFAFMQYGEVRISFEELGSNAQWSVNRIRNLSTEILFSESGGDAQGKFDLDIPVIPGDLVRIRHGNGSRIINTRLKTNGQDLWPGVRAERLEGNRSAT